MFSSHSDIQTIITQHKRTRQMDKRLTKCTLSCQKSKWFESETMHLCHCPFKMKFLEIYLYFNPSEESELSFTGHNQMSSPVPLSATTWISQARWLVGVPVELSGDDSDMDWDNWFSHCVDYSSGNRWQGGAIPGGHSADTSILLLHLTREPWTEPNHAGLVNCSLQTLRVRWTCWVQCNRRLWCYNRAHIRLSHLDILISLFIWTLHEVYDFRVYDKKIYTYITSYDTFYALSTWGSRSLCI